ncbi:MAG: hypothetical protein WB510_14225 [Candidatus Sulfotelmatobacter sp.]
MWKRAHLGTGASPVHPNAARRVYHHDQPGTTGRDQHSPTKNNKSRQPDPPWVPHCPLLPFFDEKWVVDLAYTASRAAANLKKY